MEAERHAPLAPLSSSTGTGRLRRLFQLGQGGMGSVDVAIERGDGSFQRIVALKRVLRENAADPRNREMFFREARLAALLSHPNVVHAFNFGELDGEPFLTMEYVEGEALSRLVAAAADLGAGLPVHIAIHLLADLCEGLHAVHELRDVDGTALNVVHRDLSPHNVMVSYAGHVKLLDFGIAKFDTASDDMTRTGEVKGKVAYMSPEQALGEKVDRRSDLYALGAMLFELVTGRRMWGAGTEFEVMRRLALEDPPSLREALPDAPESLSTLFAELVARKRNARPATAADVSARLREIARATGGDGREAVERHMIMVFGGRAEERRTTMAHALKLQEGAPVAGPPSRGARLANVPTQPGGRGTGTVSRVLTTGGRLNVAIAVLAVGLASALALAVATFASKAPPSAVDPSARAVQPAGNPAPTPPPSATLSTLSIPTEPSPTPAPVAPSKRATRPAAQAQPTAAQAAPAHAEDSAPQATSTPPPPSVPLKRGSDMPLIPSPVP
jgi:serine/threonine-protein kinase